MAIKIYAIVIQTYYKKYYIIRSTKYTVIHLHIQLLYIYTYLIHKTTRHGLGNHPGESGHGLTNFLILYIKFEYKHYQNK